MCWNLSDLATPYLLIGHEYIGKLVKRVFNKNEKPTYGTIVGWLPENEEGDPPIWHIQHTDGDEEDVEENEISELVDSIPLEHYELEPNIVEKYSNKLRGQCG